MAFTDPAAKAFFEGGETPTTPTDGFTDPEARDFFKGPEEKTNFERGLDMLDYTPARGTARFLRDGSAEDLASSFGVGSNALLSAGGTLYGLATGHTDNWARRQGEFGIKYWTENKTPEQTAREERRAQAIAQQEGEISKAGVAIWETLSDPVLMANFLTEQIPMTVVPGAAGAATAKGLGAAGAGTGAAIAAGSGVAYGSGAALQGADSAQTAQEMLDRIPDEIWAVNPDVQKMLDEGVPLEQAIEDVRLDLSRDAFQRSALVSLFTNLIPGARAIDKALVGVKVAPGSKLFNLGKNVIGEGVQEGIEESSAKFFANLAVSEVDPFQGLSEGVGEATGLGVLGGAAMGGAATALQGVSEDAETPQELERKAFLEDVKAQLDQARTQSTLTVEQGDDGTVTARHIRDVNGQPLEDVFTTDNLNAMFDWVADRQDDDGLTYNQVDSALATVQRVMNTADLETAIEVANEQVLGADNQGPIVRPQDEPDEIEAGDVPEYFDVRLKRDEFRDYVQSQQNSLERGGHVGKAGTIWEDGQGGTQTLVGTGASGNSQSVQNVLAETGLTVAELDNAINKALGGERLGSSQSAAVRLLLDQYSDIRTVGYQDDPMYAGGVTPLQEARTQLRERREQRWSQQQGERDRTEGEWEALFDYYERAGEIFEESEYPADFTEYERLIADHVETLDEAGWDVDSILAELVDTNATTEATIERVETEIEQAVESGQFRPSEDTARGSGLAGEESAPIAGAEQDTQAQDEAQADLTQTRLLSENSPPPAAGTVRLYRGEHPDQDRDVFETTDQDDGLMGGWFTDDQDYADYFKATQEVGRGGGRIVYVDVPQAELDQYRVDGTPLGDVDIRQGEGAFFIPQLRGESLPEPVADKPQDLLGEVPVTQQALSDRERELDEQRNTGSTDMTGTLFGQDQAQVDIADAAQSTEERQKFGPSGVAVPGIPEQYTSFKHNKNPAPLRWAKSEVGQKMEQRLADEGSGYDAENSTETQIAGLTNTPVTPEFMLDQMYTWARALPLERNRKGGSTNTFYETAAGLERWGMAFNEWAQQFPEAHAKIVQLAEWQQSVAKGSTVRIGDETFTVQRAHKHQLTLDRVPEFHDTPSVLRTKVTQPDGPTAEDIDAAANAAATSPQNDLPEPTEAQKEAGNYKKGEPFTLHGLTIRIENPKGSERKGVAEDGTEWSSTMGAHYGDIKRTTGAEGNPGEGVDVFVGENPESEQIWVIDQIDQDTGAFDEHKVMMGFTDQKAALDAYLESYDEGWKVGPVTETNPEAFREWLDEGDQMQPFGGEITTETEEKQEVSKAEPFNAAVGQEVQLISRGSVAIEKAEVVRVSKGGEIAHITDGENTRQFERGEDGIYTWSNGVNRWSADLTKDTDQDDMFATPQAVAEPETAPADETQVFGKDPIDVTPDDIPDQRERTDPVDQDIENAYAETAARYINAGLAEDKAMGMANAFREAAYNGAVDQETGAPRDVDAAVERADDINKAEAKLGYEFGYRAREQQGTSIDPRANRAPEPAPTVTMPSDDMAGLTVPEIKDKVRNLGMRPAGRKADMLAQLDGVARLVGRIDAMADILSREAELLDDAEWAQIRELKESISSWSKANIVKSHQAYKPGTSKADWLASVPAWRERVAGAVSTSQPSNEAAEIDTPTQATEQIDDFGEKIGGARKDTYASRLSEALPDDAADITLAKHFPEPKYQDLIAEGVEPRMLAYVKAMRDMVPRKPTQRGKRQRWAEQLRVLREFSTMLLNGEMTMADFEQRVKDDFPRLEKLLDQAQLYMDIGFPDITDLKGMTIEHVHYGLFEGRKNVDKFDVRPMFPGKAWDGFRGVQHFDSYPAAVEALRARLEATPDTPTGKKRKTTLDIYRERLSGRVWIGKKVGTGKYLDLREFEDVETARAYLAENEESLLEELDRRKTVPSMRRERNEARVGKDHREGRNITPDQFSRAFGFRGVEFGNWVENDKRQESLNDAYDALMDLSGLLGISTQAISLDGRLGLAFGARGKGGKGAPAAHYEPGKVVINLTKKQGAGSLAHEWWHALDNYFAKDVKGLNYVTRGTRNLMKYGTLEGADPGIRTEMIAAFSDLMTAIRASGMPERSEILDSRKTKDYWATDIELSARAFEKYVIDTAEQQGQTNDYLANIVSPELWAAEEAINQAFTTGNFDADAVVPDTYPYPMPEEAAAINPMFEQLFEEMQERTTEQGQALFSLEDVRQEPNRGMNQAAVRKAVQAQVAKVADSVGLNVLIMHENQLPDVVQKQIPANKGVKGVVHNNTVYLISNNLENSKDARTTFAHEVVGHLGVNAIVGERWPDLVASYRKMAKRGGKQFNQVLGMMDESYETMNETQQVAEFIAHAAEARLSDGSVRSFMRRVREFLNAGLRVLGFRKPFGMTEIDEILTRSEQFIETGVGAAARPTQVAQFSLFDKSRRATGVLLPDEEAVVEHGGFGINRERFKGFNTRFFESKRIAKNVFRQYWTDPHDAIRNILGDIQAWKKMHMSNSYLGGLEAGLNFGRLRLHEHGVIDVDQGEMGLVDILSPLGADLDRFLIWIVGHRANRLLNETDDQGNPAPRERRFNQAQIDIMMSMAEEKEGTEAYREGRPELFEQVREEFEAWSNAIVDIAVETGLVNQEEAMVWRDEGFYLPFYRVMQEGDNVPGPRVMQNTQLVRQTAYKRLKGADMEIDDLLGNALANWAHLLSASLKNQAAREALSSAEAMGLAARVSASAKDKDAVFVRVDGKEVWYDIGLLPGTDDMLSNQSPVDRDELTETDAGLVLEALTAIHYNGMQDPVWKALRWFKRAHTFGVTASPEFKVANLIRDSISALAVTQVDLNPFRNVYQGFRETAETGDTLYAEMLASGAIFGQSGYIHGGDQDAIRAMIAKGVDRRLIGDTEERVKDFWNDWIVRPFRAYDKFGNRFENANRAAEYRLLRDENRLDAAFAARDQLDFSRMGAGYLARRLAASVSFINARIQGLDKLGRAVADENQRKRFGTVLGYYTLLSSALYFLARMIGGDDWDELEDWERDTYHMIPLGRDDEDTMMWFRIPRPFEVGAIANIGERVFEQMVENTIGDGISPTVVAERAFHAVWETFKFQPIPQAVAPGIEVWNNQSWFTGRPIESLGMEMSNVSTSLRSRPWTSQTAKAASFGGEKVIGQNMLSPVQIDHLINGYFGWLGNTSVSVFDMMVSRPLADAPDTPTMTLDQYPLAKRFLKLSVPRNTKSGTEFYDQMDEIRRHWGDIKYHLRRGNDAQADAIELENEDSLQWRKVFESQAETLSQLTAEQNEVYSSRVLNPDEKQREIRRIQKEKNQIVSEIMKEVRQSKS